jgi:serine/threonine-protein kinase
VSLRVGRYEILGRLAVGGMSELFLARTGPGGDAFRREVVLKRLLPERAADAEWLQMFLDEARLAANLHHPGIVQVFDLGDADGVPFLVMERVRGRTLHDVMRAAAAQGRPIPLDAAMAIVIRLCEALHHAHELQDGDGTRLEIVHRDVAPKNVLVGEDGVVKLLDFGVAKSRSQRSRTHADLVKGTPEFMAPEQAEGRAVDRRADIWSVGLLLRALAGEAPRALPALARAPARATDRDPAGRWPTAEALQIELENVAREAGLATSSVELARLVRELFGDEAHGPPLTAVAPWAPPRPGARARRWRLGAALALAIAAGGALDAWLAAGRIGGAATYGELHDLATRERRGSSVLVAGLLAAAAAAARARASTRRPPLNPA